MKEHSGHGGRHSLAIVVVGVASSFRETSESMGKIILSLDQKKSPIGTFMSKAQFSSTLNAAERWGIPISPVIHSSLFGRS